MCDDDKPTPEQLFEYEENAGMVERVQCPACDRVYFEQYRGQTCPWCYNPED